MEVKCHTFLYLAN